MDNVLNFLNNWLENKGAINPSDTDTLKEFMSGLGTEINKLSIDPPQGANKLILYGGMNGDVPMWQIAKGASDSGQGYYYISNTEAGKILNNDEIKDALREICDYDKNLYDKIFGNPVNDKRFFSDDMFSVEMAVAKLDYSSSHVSYILHQFKWLKLVDTQVNDDNSYSYQLNVNPKDDPELFSAA